MQVFYFILLVRRALVTD